MLYIVIYPHCTKTRAWEPKKKDINFEKIKVCLVSHISIAIGNQKLGLFLPFFSLSISL